MKLVTKDEGEKTSLLQILGALIILAGIGTLIGVSCADFNKEHMDHSKLAGIGFLMIMLGISFIFPSMLEGYEGISTMRVAVYIIISVFITLAIKDGWNADKLITIDTNWMYIILTALGGKTVQSYTDALKSKYTSSPPDNKKDETNNTDLKTSVASKTPSGPIKQS